MEHRECSPGAVQYGNFMNYYQFKNNNERVSLMPRNAWIWNPTTNKACEKDEPYLILDVGCNAGDFTLLLQAFIEECVERPVHVFGVDIDPRLIERCMEANSCTEKVSYACVDVMNESSFDKVLCYLKQHNRQKFDAISCYSVTMWIHLNHHDSGLKLFLQKMSQLAELLIVEPQPWKCYLKAKRRLQIAGEAFPLFSKLQWRLDVDKQIELFLEQLLKRKKVYECNPCKWQRQICFYR